MTKAHVFFSALIWWLCLLSTSLYTSTAWAETQLKVTGLKGELEDNVSAYLSNIKPENYSVSLRFQSRVEDNIRNALKALGYYDPSIVFTVQGENDNQTLVVDVAAGDPTLIYESDLVIDGEASTDLDFIQLLDDPKLKMGQVVNHGYYESLKSAIRNLALRKGYFDGEFTDTRLQIAPSRNQAFVRIHYQSGARYRFGETSILGSQIEQKRILSLIPYQAGDPYDSTQVGILNQNLSSTEWFSSVAVEPNLSALSDERWLPMTVRLKPQTRNQIEVGLGYSTDVGPRGQFSWKKPWLNRYGHSIGTSLQLSAPEKTITATYKIPLDDVLKDYYTIQYGFKDEDDNDTVSQEQNLSFERHWLLDNGWHITGYTRLLYEDYTQASVSGESTFVLPGVSFSRVRSKGETMPMWGDKQSVTLEAGDPALFSDTRIIRVMAHTGWIRGIGTRHRFLTRFDVGGAFADDWDEVPPSLRFFVGGINSLRGYDYESISPEDDRGELTGGAYMATSSFEYQYRLMGNWWLASFVDIGDAWTDELEWKQAVGLGVRWASPVGPIRLDFAYGLDAEKGDEFKIHFALGPEL